MKFSTRKLITHHLTRNWHPILMGIKWVYRLKAAPELRLHRLTVSCSLSLFSFLCFFVFNYIFLWDFLCLFGIDAKPKSLATFSTKMNSSNNQVQYDIWVFNHQPTGMGYWALMQHHYCSKYLTDLVLTQFSILNHIHW